MSYISTINPPLISVIIATKNTKQTINSVIESLLVQTSKNYEILIVDGASTDGSVAELEKFSRHFAYFVSEPDHGVYFAWNKAILKAKGKWLIFLGADDELAHDSSFEEAVPHLCHAERKGARFVYGDLVVERPEKKTRLIKQNLDENKNIARGNMPFLHAGTFHYHSLFQDRGCFNTRFRFASDYEFLLSFMKNENGVYVPGLQVTRFRTGGLTTSPKNFLQILKEMAEIRRIHNIRRTIISFQEIKIMFAFLLWKIGCW